MDDDISLALKVALGVLVLFWIDDKGHLACCYASSLLDSAINHPQV